MAQVRYAVAGQPITHSLSPLLFGLVHANLLKLGQSIHFRLASQSLHLVETSVVGDALAWGYAGFTPKSPNWDVTGAPFDKFRTNALLEKAILAGTSVEDSDERLLPNDDLFLESRQGAARTIFDFNSDVQLPTDFLEQEVWMNFTSPLKHQLDSKAVLSIDKSMKLNSVNSLRWDGKTWWCAGVDGAGIVSLAVHHGISVQQGAVLGIAGGGGAARSTASAWLEAGGEIVTFEGRRELDASFTERSLKDVKVVDFAVDFDNCPSLPEYFTDSNLILKPSYQSMEGDVEQRIQALCHPYLDGRWMLVSQHLEAWSQLWAPQFREYLPSIDLLLTQLVHAENLLSTYA